MYDSDDCPLPTGRLSIDEIAWIGSIMGIGGLFGTVLFGWFADRIGRKNSLLATAVPQIVSTLLPKYRTFFNKIVYPKINHSFSTLDQLFAGDLCPKCVLFVCIAFDW